MMNLFISRNKGRYQVDIYREYSLNDRNRDRDSINRLKGLPNIREMISSKITIKDSNSYNDSNSYKESPHQNSPSPTKSSPISEPEATITPTNQNPNR